VVSGRAFLVEYPSATRVGLIDWSTSPRGDLGRRIIGLMVVSSKPVRLHRQKAHIWTNTQSRALVPVRLPSPRPNTRSTCWRTAWTNRGGRRRDSWRRAKSAVRGGPGAEAPIQSHIGRDRGPGPSGGVPPAPFDGQTNLICSEQYA